MPPIVKLAAVALKKISTSRIFKRKKEMFGLFKKKSPVEKLQEKHKKILEQAFQLSKSERSASDKLYAEAAEIEKEISRHS